MVTAAPQSKGLMSRVADLAQRAFSALGSGGYDAVKDTGRRTPPNGVLRSEDAELNANDRRRLVSGVRDINRNFTIASWMVRRHLDYVTTFKFQCRSGNPELNTKVEALVESWNRPANCDVTGRFPLSRIVRMLEARRVLDGDVFIHKIRNGLINVIEGDRVRTPIGGISDTSVQRENLVHGIELNAAGGPNRYAVNKRGKPSDLSSVGTFTFERMVPAKHIYHFGYFDRFDQVRGISPMTKRAADAADAKAKDDAERKAKGGEAGEGFKASGKEVLSTFSAAALAAGGAGGSQGVIDELKQQRREAAEARRAREQKRIQEQRDFMRDLDQRLRVG
jgi:capsid protein